MIFRFYNWLRLLGGVSCSSEYTKDSASHQFVHFHPKNSEDPWLGITAMNNTPSGAEMQHKKSNRCILYVYDTAKPTVSWESSCHVVLIKRTKELCVWRDSLQNADTLNSYCWINAINSMKNVFWYNENMKDYKFKRQARNSKKGHNGNDKNNREKSESVWMFGTLKKKKMS